MGQCVLAYYFAPGLPRMWCSAEHHIHAEFWHDKEDPCADRMAASDAPGITFSEVKEVLGHIYRFEDAPFQASQAQQTCTQLAQLLVRVNDAIAQQVRVLGAAAYTGDYSGPPKNDVVCSAYAKHPFAIWTLPCRPRMFQILIVCAAAIDQQYSYIINSQSFTHASGFWRNPCSHTRHTQHTCQPIRYSAVAQQAECISSAA